jgi:hypothetical protein
MALGEELEKRLKKTYEPSSMIEIKYKGNDVAFKTDEEGHPVLLFIGKKQEDGSIKGDRYARTLKHDRNGAVIKDHWERKGKAT